MIVFSGYLHTVTGTYSLGFFFTGGIAAFGGFSMFAVQYFHSKNKMTAYLNSLRKGCSTQQSKKIISFMQNHSKPDHSRKEKKFSVVSKGCNSYSSLVKLNDTAGYVDDSVTLERCERILTQLSVSSDESTNEPTGADDLKHIHVENSQAIERREHIFS